MCGIIGYFRLNDRIDLPTVRASEAAHDRTVHGGLADPPSGKGTGGACLLARPRLSIIDLSPNGQQPMSNEEGSRGHILSGEIFERSRSSVLNQRFMSAARLQPERLEATLARGREGHSRHFCQAWALYVLSLRHRRWVEGER